MAVVTRFGIMVRMGLVGLALLGMGILYWYLWGFSFSGTGGQVQFVAIGIGVAAAMVYSLYRVILPF
ncbi:MAG: hypothetical protein ACQESG_07855 [Nanobdellota archaeon]